MVSPQVRQAAQARRAQRQKAKIQWFTNQVQNNISIGMSARIRLCLQLLRDQVVVNISDPVAKVKGPRSGRIQVVPSSRSKPGEFPKADTTRLMKDIFYEVTGQTGIVGTSLDYGLILETRMDRSFLVRTMNETRPVLTTILTSGRGGGAGLSFPGEVP